VGISPVVEKALPLSGTRPVQEEAVAALKEGDYAKGLADLVILGRDADAARILSAALREEPGKLGPKGALAGLPGAFFAGEFGTLSEACTLARPLLESDADIARDGLMDARDMLWHALSPSLGALPRDRATMLGVLMRPEVLVRDAQEAASAVRAALGQDAVREIVERARRLATSDAEREKIDLIGR
jgi:hypothetical protein